MKATCLIQNIGELASPTGNRALKGKEMRNISIIRDAAILVEQDTIVWLGPASELPALEGPKPEFIDAGGKAVIPGFVDSHTHFVFGGYRDEEFFWRAGGLPYMEIHSRGGGIASSVKATRDASLEQLVATAAPRLEHMLKLGVTTVEGKSGYGLDLDTEIRQLKAMRILEASQAVDIIPTFMGAHSVPMEYKGRAGAYINFIIEKVMPVVIENSLAKFCDVFCEKGVFEIEDSRRLLKAAKTMGLEIKLHADEIVPLGGAELAAELSVVSADHLLKASEHGLSEMAKAGVVATCLPLTAFSLKEPYAEARKMIDAGLAVAIASDLNPGSCYSQSIPLAAALSVLYMNLSMEETLTALTLNGAAALGLAHDRGSLEPGKLADMLILDAPSYLHLAYNIGMNKVGRVIKKGKLVCTNN
ncbi:imidazolonepropionase [Spirochaetota bacterium]